jgi:nucleotide-binding universal stress UspA family protein
VIVMSSHGLTEVSKPRLLGGIVAPVDLSPSSTHQVHVASGLAEALDLPLIVLHVVEPVRSRWLSGSRVAGLETSRRAAAEAALRALIAELSSRVKKEALVVACEPADEAARLVRNRDAGLVVMGLHHAAARSGNGIGHLSDALPVSLARARATDQSTAGIN